MPKKQNDTPYYLGIDPGMGGGAALVGDDGVLLLKFGDSTDHDVAAFFSDTAKIASFAVVEQQSPRPTKTNKGVSILRSTCVLYGHYQKIMGMLAVVGVPHEAVTPRKWQKFFNLKKSGGETDTKWKNRLKGKAQQLFPKVKVTLALADALLIARYCQLTGVQ